ncbi:hypothetical protein [Microbispora sp. NPDC049125]|uniref:hypothetical protein n=1 Tax=Microbispora sp. NPDC049125 TaxID=3154929 RepID=UPI0034657EAB
MTIAEISAEFPLDLLEPLQALNVDFALLVRQAFELINATEDNGNVATLSMLVDVLVLNPHLPSELLAAVKEMGKRLLSEDGYALLMAQRPSPWDIGALVSDLFAWYGVSLGESSPSSESSTNGAISNTTSETASASTPEVSGDTPPIPASSPSSN